MKENHENKEKQLKEEEKEENNHKFKCKKDYFSLDNQIIYLNCAAYSPIMNSSKLKGIEGINMKCNPQNIISLNHFDKHNILINYINVLINSQNYQRIAIFPSVSYGMAIVAANLERHSNILNKKNIIILQDEFPNDYYAFLRVTQKLNLEILQISSTNDLDTIGEIWNQNIINSITNETALVVIPNIHWFYGILFDLKKISQKCKECDTLLVIDGSQSVGVIPFDIQEIQPDALIVAGYKWLFGPYSISFGYFGSFFDNGIPIEESWMNRTNSMNFSSLTIHDPNYHPYAQRYNMGEFSQFINCPMLIDSISTLLEWNINEIKQYIDSITIEPLNQLLSIGCKVVSEEYRSTHLFGLQLPSLLNPSEIVQILKSNYNIYVSLRGPLLRISVNVYNSQDDLWKFVEAIQNELNKVKNIIHSNDSDNNIENDNDNNNKE